MISNHRLPSLLPPALLWCFGAGLFGLAHLPLAATALAPAQAALPWVGLGLGGLGAVWGTWQMAAVALGAQQAIKACQQHEKALAQAATQLAAGHTLPAQLRGPLADALRQLEAEWAATQAAQAQQRALEAEVMALTDGLVRAQHTDALAEALLRALANRLQLVAAACYQVQDHESFHPLATWGMTYADAVLHAHGAGAGLLEQAHHSHEPVHLTGLPAEFLRVQSGLGAAQATALLLVPLRFEGQLLAVLELARFGAFQPDQLALIQPVAARTATLLFNLQTASQTQRMLQESQRLAQEVQQMNEQLEARVAERTHALEATLRELQDAQHRMILNEKMASLGTLIAGVAHEINTPLAAIKASAENMRDYLPQVLERLPALLSSLKGEDLQAFEALVAHSRDHREGLTSREERRIRKELQTELDSMGIPANADLARDLVACGLYAGLAPYRALLSHPQRAHILQAAYALAQIRLNLSVIGSAVEKTRKTVYALKSYTHVQHEEMMAPVDLVDNLEVVLTMYHNQLKHGVTLRRHYDHDLAPVWGYADELNQVWTNLLHNSAQAINYNGEIDIYIQRASEAEAVVRIQDNGPGVPPEIQQRIFEPFFTTKPQGEGSGLGLDICRKIIEKHGGRIQLESQPGHTVFSVFLPYEPPQCNAAPAVAAKSTLPAADTQAQGTPPNAQPLHQPITLRSL